MTSNVSNVQKCPNNIVFNGAQMLEIDIVIHVPVCTILYTTPLPEPGNLTEMKCSHH